MSREGGGSWWGLCVPHSMNRSSQNGSGVGGGGGSMSGSCTWRYEQKEPAKLVLRQGWSLMRGSCAWRYEQWSLVMGSVPDGMNSGRWWGVRVPDGMNSGRWWGIRVPDGMNSGRWWGVRVPDGMNSGRWWGVRVPDGMNSGRWWGVRVPDGMNRGVCITVNWKWVISQEHGLSSQMSIVMALTEGCWPCFLFFLVYVFYGAGIAQWLERRTRDRKVLGSNPDRGGRIFFFMVHFLWWLLGIRSTPVLPQ